MVIMNQGVQQTAGIAVIFTRCELMSFWPQFCHSSSGVISMINVFQFLCLLLFGYYTYIKRDIHPSSYQIYTL
jgi:hypothetical protein